MFTINNIKLLRQQLHEVIINLDEMSRTKTYDKLFDSFDDLELSKKSRCICPEDYYKFRCFDFACCLRFNNRTKQYYIHFDFYIENFFDSSFYKTFQDFLEHDNLSVKQFNFTVDDTSFNLPLSSNISFESSVVIFKRVIHYYISKTLNDSYLFEVF